MLAGAAIARADEPERRVIVVGAVSADLMERVRGQIGDLPWIVVRRDVITPRRDGLDDVRSVARSESATVALWLDETETSVTVNVLEVEERRLFARTIAEETEREPMSRSARLEAAALVVRAALRDLADGGHIGVAVPEAPAREPRTAPAAIPSRSTERPVSRPIDRPSRSDARSVTRFAASAGWAWGIDGQSPGGQTGPAGTLAIEQRWLRVELGFTASLGASLEDERTTVRMARHVFRIGVGIVLDVGRTASVAALATGGLAWLSRATVEVSEGVTATPESSQVLATFGVAARFTWLPIAGVLGIEPVAGIDVVPGAPVLGYRAGDQVVVRNRLWILSPWLGVAAVVRTP